MNAATTSLPLECSLSLAEKSRDHGALLAELARQLGLLLPDAAGYVTLSTPAGGGALVAAFGSMPQLAQPAATELIEAVFSGFDTQTLVLKVKESWKHGFPPNTESVAGAPIRDGSRSFGGIIAGFASIQAAQSGLGLLDAVAALASILAVNAHEYESLAAHALYLSEYDALVTGLPNRRLLRDRTRAALLEGTPVLLFLDLDGFNEINRRHGYAAGDAALAEVAQRWRTVVDQRCPDAILARMGGDEFAVLMPACDGAAPEALAEALLSSLREPLHEVGDPWLVRASAGISHSSTQQSTNVESLLRRAEQAMYQAKEAGGGQYACAPEDETPPRNPHANG